MSIKCFNCDFRRQSQQKSSHTWIEINADRQTFNQDWNKEQQRFEDATGLFKAFNIQENQPVWTLTIIVGMVNVLRSWNVPTALFCRERFVRATKPQKVSASGSTVRRGMRTGLKTLKCRHIARPRVVTMKCVHERVTFGKPIYRYTHLLRSTIAIDTARLSNIQSDVRSTEACRGDGAPRMPCFMGSPAKNIARLLDIRNIVN